MHINLCLILFLKAQPGPDKFIAQLPGTSPDLGWASDFLFHLPRKMYRIYKEYCNSKLFTRCCGLPGKWLNFNLSGPGSTIPFYYRVIMSKIAG